MNFLMNIYWLTDFSWGRNYLHFMFIDDIFGFELNDSAKNGLLIKM